MNPERFRDQFQMLKFSLRSVEKHLPWINRIYIVTNSPQIPDWLDTMNDRVQVVHLEDFIPAQYLPSFSSNAIESFLHLLPGLSEHFIYMNDDFFIGAPVGIEDFWANGKYAIFNTFVGENLKWRVYDKKNNIVGLGLIEHGPHFAKKEYWQKMTELLPQETEQTRLRKFRHPDNLVTYKLYRRYMLSTHRRQSRAVPIWEFLKTCVFHKITNEMKFTQAGLSKIITRRPKYFCLNDDQRMAPNEKVVKVVKDFLNQLYPEKSGFEKPTKK